LIRRRIFSLGARFMLGKVVSDAIPEQSLLLEVQLGRK